MLGALGQMAALVALGVGWRLLRPGGVEADTARRVLAALVYYLFLPALVLHLLWTAPLGWDAARIAGVAAVGVVTTLGLAWLAYRWLRPPKAAFGAVLLAAAFGNVTYLGLPVLEATFGPWARTVAVEYDLFACSPLLLTVGIVIARRYGDGSTREGPLASLLRAPPLWAAALGVALNLAAVPAPAWVTGLLERLGAPVIPVMLFSVGLALRWQAGWAGRLGLLVPAVVVQLVAAPLVVWGSGSTAGLEGDLLRAVVLEGAMPTMVLGLVICDRYRLDTGLYAEAVTVTTALSVATIPLWFRILT